MAQKIEIVTLTFNYFKASGKYYAQGELTTGIPVAAENISDTDPGRLEKGHLLYSEFVEQLVKKCHPGLAKSYPMEFHAVVTGGPYPVMIPMEIPQVGDEQTK